MQVRVGELNAECADLRLNYDVLLDEFKGSQELRRVCCHNDVL